MSKQSERKDSGCSSNSTSPRYISPYEFTRTGLIGEQRDSMLQNELHTLVCQS
jgi:hypothetical protein